MRYDGNGNENPDFVLNKPQYRSAEIILAGDNFGCGSSREHALGDQRLRYSLRDFDKFCGCFYNAASRTGYFLLCYRKSR